MKIYSILSHFCLSSGEKQVLYHGRAVRVVCSITHVVLQWFTLGVVFNLHLNLKCGSTRLSLSDLWQNFALLSFNHLPIELMPFTEMDVDSKSANEYPSFYANWRFTPAEYTTPNPQILHCFVATTRMCRYRFFISRRALAREGDYEMMSVCACVRVCVC